MIRYNYDKDKKLCVVQRWLSCMKTTAGHKDDILLLQVPYNCFDQSRRQKDRQTSIETKYLMRLLVVYSGYYNTMQISFTFNFELTAVI